MTQMLSAVLLIATLTTQAADSSPEPLFPYALQTKTLENGLTVHVVPMQSPKIVSYYTWMQVGSRNETTPGRTGFAHFFEHLMFYGTESMSRTEREQVMVKMGASENAWTWFDDTVYHGTLTTDHLEQYIGMEADRFQNLKLTPVDVKKEAGAVYGEFRKGKSSPSEQVDNTLFALAYPTHTYGHSTIGTEDDVRAMPTAFEYSQAFFDQHYRPENATILVVGDVRPEAVFEMITAQYAEWAPYTGEIVAITEEPPQEGSQRAHIDWPTPTAAQLVMGWRIPGHSTDSAALQLLADLLDSETGGLYQKLIVKNPLAYRLDVSRMSLKDPSLFTIAVELKHDVDFETVETIIREELATLQTALDEAVLAQVKAKQKYTLLSSLDTPAAVASTLGWQLRRLDTLDNYETYLRNYQQVDHEALKTAITEHLQDARLNIVTLKHNPVSETRP
jgi:zinc protease